MKACALALFLLAPAMALCSESWFRRDSDAVNRALMINGDRYEIESHTLGGKKTKNDGVAKDAGTSITFKDTGASDKHSVVHEKLFLKRNVADTLYLVEERREQEFNDLLNEKDAFLHSTYLGNYFHQVPGKPFSNEPKANQHITDNSGELHSPTCLS